MISSNLCALGYGNEWSTQPGVQCFLPIYRHSSAVSPGYSVLPPTQHIWLKAQTTSDQTYWPAGRFGKTFLPVFLVLPASLAGLKSTPLSPPTYLPPFCIEIYLCSCPSFSQAKEAGFYQHNFCTLWENLSLSPLLGLLHSPSLNLLHLAHGVKWKQSV